MFYNSAQIPNLSLAECLTSLLTLQSATKERLLFFVVSAAYETKDFSVLFMASLEILVRYLYKKSLFIIAQIKFCMPNLKFNS